MDRLKKYGFKDESGHPLENCAEYQGIFDEHKTALEQAEARADELETYISKLVCELTDGRLSKPYDISVITDEVEAIYRAYAEDEIAKATAKAEAENARLTKMVDWLADKCAMHCHDMSRDDIMCTVDTCDILTCWGASGDEWKEAARLAVAAGEG